MASNLPGLDLIRFHELVQRSLSRSGLVHRPLCTPKPERAQDSNLLSSPESGVGFLDNFGASMQMSELHVEDEVSPLHGLAAALGFSCAARPGGGRIVAAMLSDMP